MPLAGPGAALYAVIAVLCLIRAEGAWLLIQTAAVVAAGAAVWFMLVQLLVLRRLCGYCTAVHVLGLVTAAILLRTPSPVALAGGGAVVLAMVAMQLLMPAPTHVLTPAPGEPISGATLDAARQDQAAAVVGSHPLPSSSRLISVFKGRIRVHLADWPLLGPPDAPHVLVYLFDYTCHDCRHVHGLILQAIKRYEPRLAFLAVPVPINPDCNPAIHDRVTDHADACFYARLALAVWMSRSDAFEAFDRWLFAPVRPPAMDQAQRRAEQLAGQALDEVMRQPSLDEKIREAAAAFEAMGIGRVPNILLPEACIWGRVPDLPEMVRMLESQIPSLKAGSVVTRPDVVAPAAQVFSSRRIQ